MADEFKTYGPPGDEWHIEEPVTLPDHLADDIDSHVIPDWAAVFNDAPAPVLNEYIPESTPEIPVTARGPEKKITVMLDYDLWLSLKDLAMHEERSSQKVVVSALCDYVKTHYPAVEDWKAKGRPAKAMADDDAEVPPAHGLMNR